MFKLFRTYIGSKQYWVPRLQVFKDKDFIEPFCGSAVLSINLAKTAILNDIDPYIVKILQNFDQLIVPDVFTASDYLTVRKQPDWWKYIYQLQSMSFSGTFRYSKNGFNAPIKKNCQQVCVKEDYQKALARWQQLQPIITNVSYDQIPLQQFANKVVVVDPPYQNSQASYNKNSFDYDKYWTWVDSLQQVADTILLFDRASNISNRNIPIVGTRKMRVNGKHRGDQEALSIYHGHIWLTTAEI